MNKKIITITNNILTIKTDENIELKKLPNPLEFIYKGTLKPEPIEDYPSRYDNFIKGLNERSNRELAGCFKKENYTIDNLLNNKLFCEFKLENSEPLTGVYLWVVDDEIRYVGIAKNLKERFDEYGHIYHTNVFKNGRSTNCKMNMNARIWKDNKIDIYFYDTGKLENNKNSRSKTVRKRLEKYLINYLIDVGGCKLENNQK